MIDVEKIIEEVEIAKEMCVELGIDWEKIDCGYEPKVMEYCCFGLA